MAVRTGTVIMNHPLKQYDRRGYEAPEDVIALCGNFHAKFHYKLPTTREK